MKRESDRERNRESEWERESKYRDIRDAMMMSSDVNCTMTQSTDTAGRLPRQHTNRGRDTDKWNIMG